MYWQHEHTEIQGHITFNLWIAEEDEGPEGQFASGDDEADAKSIAWIRNEVQSGNQWAWCVVRVEASIDDFAGEPEYLGACSYSGLAEFIAPGADYYNDMKKAALESLKERLKRALGYAAEIGVTL